MTCDAAPQVDQKRAGESGIVQSPGAGDKDKPGDTVTVTVTSMLPAPGELVLGCLAMSGHKGPGISTSWSAMAHSCILSRGVENGLDDSIPAAPLTKSNTTPTSLNT